MSAAGPALLCGSTRALGALVVLVVIQLSVSGIVSSASIQIEQCHYRRPRRSFHYLSKLLCANFARLVRFVVLVRLLQLSVAGIVFPASVKNRSESSAPPQTIISLPVQIAV